MSIDNFDFIQNLFFLGLSITGLLLFFALGAFIADYILDRGNK
jgi:hypothetical protein